MTDSSNIGHIKWQEWGESYTQVGQDGKVSVTLKKMINRCEEGRGATVWSIWEKLPQVEGHMLSPTADTSPKTKEVADVTEEVGRKEAGVRPKITGAQEATGKTDQGAVRAVMPSTVATI